MNKPIISIIVPVYNVEKYLRPCLDSIEAQTFTDFEAILVDDGSTDNSGRICDDYAAKDTRFVVVHKHNEGVAKARITAFEHSNGDLITFIDSDDYVSPDYLEKLSRPIIEEDADMVSSNYFTVEDNKEKKAKDSLAGIYNKSQIVDFLANHFFFDNKNRGYGMNVFLCTKMVKRNYVKEALSYGNNLWYAEDQICVFHILQHCNKLVIIPDRLYYYVQHEGQAMRKYDMALWNNLILLMQKYRDLDKENIAEEGRRKRTWRHIDYTIFNKMAKANLSRGTFCEHLSQVRNLPYMKDFFTPYHIDFSLKENIKYWILKLRLFKLFYYIVRRNQERSV